jgi:hypothetical protein
MSVGIDAAGKTENFVKLLMVGKLHPAWLLYRRMVAMLLGHDQSDAV